MQENFIFIVSAPRSGSTWLGNLFNSHPDVIYRHEPLARLAPLIEMETGLLHRLKQSHGISVSDRRHLLNLLYKAHPESDRPPFFKKSISYMPSSLRFLLWTAAIKWRPFAVIYENLFSSSLPGKILVTKETGWSSHLESIVHGLQPTATLLLVRHPCAIISSILRGIDTGLMPAMDIQMKREWYAHHRNKPFISDNALQEKDILQMETLAFWSIRLRVLYDIFLSVYNHMEKVSLLVYEDLQRDPQEGVTGLFASLDIPMAPNVIAFIEESTGKRVPTLQALQKKGKSGYYSVHRHKDYDPWQWCQQLAPGQISQVCDIVGKDIIQRFWPNASSNQEPTGRHS